MEAANQPEEMEITGFHFHSLQGKPKRWSVRVTGNFRITFGWQDETAVDVDFEDYH
jgi:proteic killer suppression protein